MRWNTELDRHIARITGPLDEFDDETNGDPDSLVGEEDESGYAEMADWKEWAAFDDDGFEDAGESDDDDEAEGDPEAEDEEE